MKLLAAFATLISVAQAAQVAVIGAGAAGLSGKSNTTDTQLVAAHVLSKQGYKVTVYEAANTVGGFANSVKVPATGEAYDLSTMFVPGSGIAGPGIEPNLLELIQLSGEKIVPAVDFDTLGQGDYGYFLESHYEILKGYNASTIVPQFIKGLSLATKFAMCFSKRIGCVQCGICAREEETLVEFGDRVGIPAYVKMITYVFDGLGANPAVDAPVRAIASSFAVVDAVRILRQLGINKPEALPEGTLPNIKALVSDPNFQRWWSFDRGYQTFWQKVAQRGNFTVKMSSPVTKMTFDQEKKNWKLQILGRCEEVYDKVVMALHPPDAVKILPKDLPQAELLKLGTTRAPPNSIFLVKVKHFERTGLPSKCAFWPQQQGLGTQDIINTSQAFGGSSKLFFWQKRRDSNYMIVGTVNANKIPKKEEYKLIRSFAKKMGFSIVDELAYARYDFPSGPHPKDNAAWNSGWAALQGQQGLVFTGEAVAGSGVPTITA